MRLGSILVFALSAVVLVAILLFVIVGISSPNVNLTIVVALFSIAVLYPIPAIPAALRRLRQPWRPASQFVGSMYEFLARAVAQGFSVPTALQEYTWSVRMGSGRTRLGSALKQMGAGEPLSVALRQAGLITHADAAILAAAEMADRVPDALQYLARNRLHSRASVFAPLIVIAEMTLLMLGAYIVVVLARAVAATPSLFRGVEPEGQLLVAAAAALLLCVCLLALLVVVMSLTSFGQVLANDLFPSFRFSYWRVPLSRLAFVRHLLAFGSGDKLVTAQIAIDAAGDPVLNSQRKKILFQLDQGASLESAISSIRALPRDLGVALSATPEKWNAIAPFFSEIGDDEQSSRFSTVMQVIIIGAWILMTGLLLSGIAVLNHIVAGNL